MNKNARKIYIYVKANVYYFDFKYTKTSKTFITEAKVRAVMS